MSHTLLPLPKLTPEETPAVPAGSSLSQSAAPPGGLQHRGAGISTTPSLLLKIEPVNETYHTKYWTPDTVDCTEFYAWELTVTFWHFDIEVQKVRTPRFLFKGEKIKQICHVFYYYKANQSWAVKKRFRIKPVKKVEWWEDKSCVMVWIMMPMTQLPKQEVIMASWWLVRICVRRWYRNSPAWKLRDISIFTLSSFCLILVKIRHSCWLPRQRSNPSGEGWCKY